MKCLMLVVTSEECMGFYYLGLTKKIVQNNDFFKKAIVLEGGTKNDISYKIIHKEKIDYNNNDIENVKKICKFYDRAIDEIRIKDCDSKFMMYNQFTIEYMKNAKYVQCVNDISLIKKLNNKIRCREILEDIVTLLDYKYLKLNDIDFKRINNSFDCKYKKYVVQQPIGFAGVGTYVLDNSDSILKYLNSDSLYSVSGFIENAISLNNTFMISDNYIYIFCGSYQKIKIGEELNYDGWDFSSYEKLSKAVKNMIYNQTLKIAQILQSLGYRGIGGVDYLLKDKDLYFMEINPRFQASSEALDKKLVNKGFPSIFELNYWSFYEEEKFISICKLMEDSDE